MPDIKYAQTEAVDKGSLKVEVLTNRTRRPIEGARITISYSGDPDSTVEEVSADDSGMSEKLTLDAPMSCSFGSYGKSSPIFSLYSALN